MSPSTWADSRPVVRRCWSGEYGQWGWSVTRGWWTAWGATISDAWHKYSFLVGATDDITERQMQDQEQPDD